MLRGKGFKNVDDKNQMCFSVSGILVCVLRACLQTMKFELGVQVHGWSCKMGFSRSVVLSSFLISYYGRAKFLVGAERVFEQERFKNTAVWTSRIVNFCNDDKFEEAICVFKDMGREGVRKNGYTFSAVLRACRKTGYTECGQQVYANVIKLGLDSNSYVQRALLDL
ncbi:Pentatricopeptide repeat-containing protein [Striga hermonthica]|uniref:Pentatricopeptide repeat-containing protein n=1 Tax=Striga hermonthica TaxID=68872 RepID=A0A9N7N4P8_STRHE|nr:Pentatricopeptide repeat-containing protein [Striga hermonthica]